MGTILPPTADNPMGDPHAEAILDEAIHVMRKRASDRDVGKERTMKQIVAVFNTLTGQNLSETEGWKFMLVLKMVRSQNGKFKVDDYLDMTAYAALMGESHSQE